MKAVTATDKWRKADKPANAYWRLFCKDCGKELLKCDAEEVTQFLPIEMDHICNNRVSPLVLDSETEEIIEQATGIPRPPRDTPVTDLYCEEIPLVDQQEDDDDDCIEQTQEA